jgi:phospholipase D1/2
MAEPVLVPGTTCWRIARADRMAVIVDAAGYFRYAKEAILRARHSVLLIGWDFDTRIKLDRDDPAPHRPNTLGSLLEYVVRHNEGLHVYVLRWDFAALKLLVRGTTPLFLLDCVISSRLHLKLDSHHPAEGCHHQKIAVVDDAIAFCGGIDITLDRWDTTAHLDQDPRRTHPDGTPHGPWHDVTVAVHGEAAKALGDLARHRWFMATGDRIEAPPPGQVRWPDELRAGFHDVDVAIARTEPAYDGQEEVHEIEALYLAAIRAARRAIYLESQYFSARIIADAVITRLAERGGPEVVIVNPLRSEGELEEEVMGSARAVLLERLRAADHEGRLRFCTPVTQEGADIYVHAKVLVVDDMLLRVGSSNINNRSLGLDTECDLAVEARPADPRAPELRRAILQVRDTLLAEHLGVARDELRRVLDEEGGSLVQTLDRLMRPHGRSLRPFQPPSLSARERRLGETHVLDPRRPEPMDETFVKTLRVLGPRRAVATALGVLALAMAAVLDLRRRQRPR